MTRIRRDDCPIPLDAEAAVMPEHYDPRPPSSPLSARIPEFACVAFALWTLCCHAVVAAGGTLTTLMTVAAAENTKKSCKVQYASSGSRHLASAAGKRDQAS